MGFGTARCKRWLQHQSDEAQYKDGSISPYFCKATSDALTAKESSMGNSGGTTEVMMRTQSSSSLPLAIPRSSPARTLANGCMSHKWLTFDPDIRARSDGKDKQEANEEECLEGIGRYAFSREDHRADELALSGPETGSEDNSKTATIGRCGNQSRLSSSRRTYSICHPRQPFQLAMPLFPKTAHCSGPSHSYPIDPSLHGAQHSPSAAVSTPLTALPRSRCMCLGEVEDRRGYQTRAWCELCTL